jgi:hypothetical protein
MPNSLPKTLAEFEGKGYVIAPAGFGKTHLIALAVREATQKQLILTHTFAGVSSIKAKLASLNVPTSQYQVDTIASWALRLCLSYPINSGWTQCFPSENEWVQLYAAGEALISKPFIQRVINESYSGIYVDEYQDCSKLQHQFIFKLSNLLPCRLLGDPLQAIFDFSEQPVNWENDVYPFFECLGQLDIPWRWINSGVPELGEWLKSARSTLEAGGKISLRGSLPKSVKAISVELDNYSDKSRYRIFYDALKNMKSTVIAIQAGDQLSKNKTHSLARALAGKFSSIEEVECKSLFSFLKKLQSAKTAKTKFLSALEFAKKCISGVDNVLTAGSKRGETAKAIKTTNVSLIPIMDSVNLYLNEPSSDRLLKFFDLVKQHPDTNVYRRDLLNRFLSVLIIHAKEDSFTLLEAANQYQQSFRHLGRPVKYPKLIGTTLLVKGLEYEHAIVIDADKLNKKQLYVAITRGAKTLTIITKQPSLPIV